MRVLVTGGTGFVGRWLVRELEAGGHVPVVAPASSILDLEDATAVGALVAAAAPDAIAHLAAISFGPDATADPAAAMRTNVGGTIAVVESAIARGVPLLAVSSSEVYRVGPDIAMPLTERSAVGPRSVYGLTKAGGEGVVLGAASRGLDAVVVRPFNHTGPGQRPTFAVPAFAGRILEARGRGDSWIRAGNVDAARDLSDVRDVVAAYRLLLEALVAGIPSTAPRLFNMASGQAVTMRDVISRLARVAGVQISVEPDPSLLRPDDPALIVGSAERLHAFTGWTPRIDLEETLRDVLAARDVELLSSRPRA